MSLKFSDLLQLTCRSLASNPVRSLLTTLGTFMGVAAVSATLQVGTISRAVITQKLADQEAPQMTLFPDWSPDPARRVRLSQADMQYLKQRLVGVQAISSMRWAGSETVLFQDQEANPDLLAVSQEYLLTSGRKVSSGRFFTPADFENYRPVVVIDQVLSNQLFRNQQPIGQIIYAGRQPYTVVGVMVNKPSDTEEAPSSGAMLMPMAFHSALTGNQTIGIIRIRPYDLSDLERLGEESEQLLMQRFPGRRFYTWNNVEEIIEQQNILNLASRALATVGLVSLLVGGVGIANIMIASVTERTSEIGIRRAIGATQQEIMVQFVLEAVILSLAGGMVAIATVHGLTLVVAHAFELPYKFDANTAAIALGAALTVGVSASFAPALRASQLDPVSALRSE